MVTICLLRHGETAFNADGNRYCGRTDIALTKKGVAQAERMRDLLKDFRFNAVYSSPLQRARMTAGIVCGNPEIIRVDQRLIEVDFGNWEGKRADEFIVEDPEAWENWMDDPARYRAGRTGESGKMVLERLHDFYGEICDKHCGETILVVGHNGVNRLFMADQLGMPLKNYRKIVQENSALTSVALDKTAGFRLLKLNA